MESAEKQHLKGWVRWVPVVFTAAGLIHTIIQVFNIVILGKVMLQQAFLGTLLLYFLSIAFLLFPRDKKSATGRIPWYDWAGFAICVVAGAFMGVFGYTANLQGWAGRPPVAAVVIGILLILAIMELMRRKYGLVLVLIVAVFLFYPLFGRYLPGMFQTNPYSVGRVVGFTFLGSEGIFGLPMGAFGRLLVGYLTFGIVLQWVGGSDFLYKAALILVGTIRGGGAKVSILSSCFFSMISGSAVANVVSVGCITIPAMKRLGYTPEYAAATEACASSGGPLTPPVMGTAAFLMAEFLEIPYGTVCVAAAIPALLYYVSMFIQNDCHAARVGLVGFPKSELPTLRSLAWGWFTPVCIVLLVFFVIYFGWESRAPYYASAALILLAFFQEKTRPNLKGLVTFLDNSAKTLSSMVIILTGIGLIIGSLGLTGIAFGIPSILLKASGGNVYLLLIFTAVAAFILGLGLNIVVVYIFLVVTLAPALIDAGIPPISAHLFVLYWATSADISPPVAIASIAAAAIAKADYWRVNWIAMGMGRMLFINSFLFVVNPLFIGQGSPLKILEAILLAVGGTIVFSCGMEGYLYWHGKIKTPSRVIAMVVGLVMLAVAALFVH